MNDLYPRNLYGNCCAVPHCSLRRGTNLLSQIKMYCIPADPDRRAAWLQAMNRPHWKPKKNCFVCCKHFIEGKPSKDPNHPDWIPSIFPPAEIKEPQDQSILDHYKQLILNRKKKQAPPRKKREPKPVSISNQPDTELNFEPEVIIKEEPIDIDEHPSTSGTDPEFIVPFTDPVQSATAVEEAFPIVKTEPVEEQQPVVTNGFSILKKAPSKEKITEEVEQSVPAEKNSANPENRSASDKHPLDAYGEYIVAELKMLDAKSCAHVQKVFAYVLADAKSGKFK